MDYNTPKDTWNHPLAPWNMPDDIEPETKVICGCCEKSEEECDCDDGFDRWVVEI